MKEQEKKAFKLIVALQFTSDLLDDFGGQGKQKQSLYRRMKGLEKELDLFLNDVYKNGSTDRNLIDLTEACQKAMDETGRCIFIKGASDNEDSCIDPPPRASPIVTPTTASPSLSPVESIVEIEEGDVVLIDNTTLTIEEEHLDMLLAPPDEEEEVEPTVESLHFCPVDWE